MNSDVELSIRQNLQWNKLAQNVKQSLGNSQKEYEKCIITFSTKNQLRFRGNLVSQVRKNERRYYEEVLSYSRTSLLLYPYHLSDIMVKGLRVTPFQYYTSMLEAIMEGEKSYDSLPNFTAADCLRLLGIGRNEYIDLMNQCRSGRKLFRRKSIKDLLPVKPVDINIEPWWFVETGCIVEQDMKLVSEEEKMLIDHIIDHGRQRAGALESNLVDNLYKKGLVYLEVPIEERDHIILPPLEGFVMNRVLGDYFETLLYKIFVSIDEDTSVGELASVLEIDAESVKNVVSLYCRLGFARKKTSLDIEEWHQSWNSNQCKVRHSRSENQLAPPQLRLPLVPPSTTITSTTANEPAELEAETIQREKRIAFLFDSTLTAFLMMGNLSPGLKSHAVTMFEVGKLSDESIDSFLAELEKVSTARDDSEGEARRYFEHALILRSTVRALRHSKNGAVGLDLVRCESLQSLDQNTCTRLLNKNYKLLVSMAPLSKEVRPIMSRVPPHLGPACPDVNSIWFKLFLYHVTANGPTSLLLARGTRVRRLPRFLLGCDRVLVTSWGHDPAVIPLAGLLFALNDALAYAPVLAQAYGKNKGSDTRLVPFPFQEKDTKSGDLNWQQHVGVARLRSELDLEHSCGYLTMVRVPYRPLRPLAWTEVEREDKRLRLFFKTSAGSLPSLDTSASSSAVEAWIQSTTFPGELKFDHYCSTPVKAALESPMNGITDQKCVEILEEELDRLARSNPPSPQNRECDSDASELTQEQASSELSDWAILDCCFGVPLFDADANCRICDMIVDSLAHPANLAKLSESSEALAAKLEEFIFRVQAVPTISYDHPSEGLLSMWQSFTRPYFNCESGNARSDPQEPVWPVTNLLFYDGQLVEWDRK